MPNVARRRLPIVVAVACAAAALSLLAAGCGGGGSSGVASVASSTTTTATAGTTRTGPAVAFSRCMRSHGVSDFPDPQRIGPDSFKLTLKPSASPRFEAALSTCHHLLPAGAAAEQEHAQLSHLLSFARCMRSHGLTRFPDPTARGELPLTMVQAQGIDVRSPAFLQAVKACLPAAHGTLTATGVQAALRNIGG